MEKSKLVELAKAFADVLQKSGDDAEKAYMGFTKLKQKLGAKTGSKKIYNPGALAAAIGRKKYGKKKFQSYATSGKKMRGVQAKGY